MIPGTIHLLIEACYEIDAFYLLCQHHFHPAVGSGSYVCRASGE